MGSSPDKNCFNLRSVNYPKPADRTRGLFAASTHKVQPPDRVCEARKHTLHSTVPQSSHWLTTTGLQRFSWSRQGFWGLYFRRTVYPASAVGNTAHIAGAPERRPPGLTLYKNYWTRSAWFIMVAYPVKMTIIMRMCVLQGARFSGLNIFPNSTKLSSSGDIARL